MPLTSGSTFFDRQYYSCNDQPKCPHCDRDIDVSEHEFYDLYEEGDHDLTCPYCEKPFVVNSVASWKFSTQDQPNI